MARRATVGAPTGWRWIGLAALMLLATRGAAAQSGYAGTYQAGPATVTVEVTAWGADCGVRPQSHTIPERPTVEVRDEGAHLALQFPSRLLRSNACWSQNPTLKVKSANTGGNSWKLECTTPPGDPKQETGRYTVTADSPFALELREESDYHWQLKDSLCVAKVRMVQRLERPDAPGAKPAPAEVPAPVKEACTPGTPTRLRLRPQEARIEPGQRVCFTARGFDAANCATELDAKALGWELEKANGARGTLAAGCFKAADSAAAAEGVFRIVVSGQGLRDEATVTVAVPDLSDITARRAYDRRGALEGDDEARGAGLAGAGVKAVGVQSDERLWWTLGLAAGATALALLMWLAALRRRPTSQPAPTSPPLARVPTPARAPAPSATPAPSPAVVAPPRQEPAAAPEPLICPVCRRGYAPGTTRCSADGTALVTYASFLQQAKAGEGHTRTCPNCGQPLMAGAAFCGDCGKRI